MSIVGWLLLNKDKKLPKLVHSCNMKMSLCNIAV